MQLNFPWKTVMREQEKLPPAGNFKEHEEAHVLRFPDHATLGNKMREKVITDPNTGLPVMAVWCEDEAEGAIPNGTRIKKRNTMDGDSVANGELGVVLGSILYPDHLPQQPVYKDKVKHLYFVTWDSIPDKPIGTSDYKIEEIT